MATITIELEEYKKSISQLPKLYTVEEIAKEYKCSIQYVRAEIKAKHLKAINFAACLKCTAADVQEWIELKRQETINKATGGNADNEQIVNGNEKGLNRTSIQPTRRNKELQSRASVI